MRHLSVLIGLLAAGIAQAQREAEIPPVLRKALGAAATLRYSGERIVEFKTGPDRRRIVEYVLRDGPRTRIEFPDDSPYRGQIIVEDANERRHFFPDRNEIRILPPRGEEVARRLRSFLAKSMQRGFRVAVSDGGEVAGFATQAIVINDPKGNAAQKLWIEPRTGTVLKRELFDPVGGRVGLFQFTRINLRPSLAPKDFEIDRRGAKVITPEHAAREIASRMGLQPALLPASSGFRLESARSMRQRGPEFLALAYVGAEGRFTLFQLKEPVSENRLRRMARGSLSTYAWTRGAEHLALVGELPEARLHEIARLLGDS